MVKGQDILLVLKLLSDGGRIGTYSHVASRIGMSASETHAAMKRARICGLVHPVEDRVLKHALEEFLLHGIRYVFPALPGGRTRGIPTGSYAPPLSFSFSSSDETLPWVWPDPEGTVSGLEITPLCRPVIRAAKRDHRLYEWLVLTDVLRGAGRAREKQLAEEQVKERLHATG